MTPPIRAIQQRGNKQIEDGTILADLRTAVEAAEETSAESRGGTSGGVENRLLLNENGELKRRIEMLTEKLTSTTSGPSSGSDSSRERKQKELNDGQKASIGAYVSSLYKRLKFLNNETMAAYPCVLQKALDQLVITKTNETQETYKSATLKELRYHLSQKRQYSKKQIMKKYIGKCKVKRDGNDKLIQLTTFST